MSGSDPRGKWRETERFRELENSLAGSRLLLLHGLPRTGKTTLIEELGLKPRGLNTAQQYINLGDLRGGDRLRNLRDTLEKAEMEGRQLAIEARTYDIFHLLRSGTNDNKDAQQLVGRINKLTKELVERLDVSGDLFASSHLLVLKHSDAEKLLDGILDSENLSQSVRQLGEAVSKEKKEVLLRYARISEDDVPGIKLGKGQGFYFLDDLIEGVKCVKSDQVTVDEAKFNELRSRVEQIKSAEEKLLSTPSLLPFIAFETIQGTMSGTIGALLGDFAAFLDSFSKPLQEFAKAALPQVPVAGIGLAFLLYIRRKDRKEQDVRTLILELVNLWRSLPSGKKVAIGECYDAATGCERGTTRRTFDIISGVAIDELEAKLGELEGITGQLETLVESQQSMKDDLRYAMVDIKSLEQRVSIGDWRDLSKVKTSWTMIENPSSLDDRALGDLLHLRPFSPEGREGQEPSFVPFGNATELMNRLSSEDLFITGMSGSGKSRVIFEALRRRRSSSSGIWLVGEYLGGNESGTLAEFCDKVTAFARESSSRQIIVWDNFPRGLLEFGNDPDACKSILKRLTSIPEAQAEFLISLDPSEYERMSDAPVDVFRSRDILRISYDRAELDALLESIGRFQLGDQEYESRVSAVKEDILDALYRNFNLPLAIEDFCSALVAEQQKNPAEIAQGLGSKEYSIYVKEQLAQLHVKDMEIEHLQARQSNTDLLYTAKLFRVLNRVARTFDVEDVQWKVFGTKYYQTEQLRNWIKLESGIYLMHDFYLATLEFNEEALKAIFDFASREGARALFTQSGSVAIPNDLKSFVLLLGEHFSVCLPDNFDRLIRNLLEQDFLKRDGVGPGIGSLYNTLESEYKSKLVALAKSNAMFAYGFGRGIGFAFDKLTGPDFGPLLDLASVSQDFAEGFGRGAGLAFSKLDYDSAMRLLEVSKAMDAPVLLDFVTSRFAYEGVPFSTLKDEDKDKAMKMISGGDSRAVNGLGVEMGLQFSMLTQTDKGMLIQAVKRQGVFASGFGYGAGLNFDELAEDDQKTMIELTRLSSQDEMRKDNPGLGEFSAGFGNGIGRNFHRINPAQRDKLMNLAVTNQRFGSEFEFVVTGSFGKLPENQNERLTRFPIEMKLPVYLCDQFFWRLGATAGRSFNRLTKECRDMSIALAKMNEDFALGLGVGITRQSTEGLSQDYVSKLEQLERRNQGFRAGRSLPMDNFTRECRIVGLPSEVEIRRKRDNNPTERAYELSVGEMTYGFTLSLMVTPTQTGLTAGWSIDRKHGLHLEVGRPVFPMSQIRDVIKWTNTSLGGSARPEANLPDKTLTSLINARTEGIEPSVAVLALNDLGVELCERRAVGSAIVVFREALAISRRLPQVTELDLAKRAKVLCNLGSPLADRHDFSKAVSATNDSVAILRSIVTKETKDRRFALDLAGSLGALGVMLVGRGMEVHSKEDYDSGISALEEAASLYRTLPATTSDARTSLYETLGNLRNAYMFRNSRGDVERTLSIVKEEVDALKSSGPSAELAQLYLTMMAGYLKLGKDIEANQHAGAAEDIIKTLEEQNSAEAVELRKTLGGLTKQLKNTSPSDVGPCYGANKSASRKESA